MKGMIRSLTHTGRVSTIVAVSALAEPSTAHVLTQSDWNFSKALAFVTESFFPMPFSTM
jgi:hypothetical protein